MAEKTIEDMKAELLAAGYIVEGRIENWWYEVEILTPDNWYIESQAYLGTSDEEAQAEAESDTVPRAYKHLQANRRAEELEALMASVADQLIQLCNEDRERGNETSALRIHVQGVAAQIKGRLGKEGGE